MNSPTIATSGEALELGCWLGNFPNIYTKTNKIFENYVKVVTSKNALDFCYDFTFRK